MKIGILTLPLHTNYGGILQAYALQTVLTKLGHEVEVLDKARKPIFEKYPFHVKLKRFIKKYILLQKITPLPDVARYKLIKKQNKYTWKFTDKHIKRREYRRIDDIKESEYDTIVVGSDQIWRPQNLPFHTTNAFLDFAKDWKIKRIAYAPSFGTSEWEYTETDTLRCKELIQLFSAVSTREISGISLLREKLNYYLAVQCVDPTLLLTKDDYIKLFNRKREKNKGNLLVYILDDSPHKDLLVSRIAEEKQLTPYRVNSKVESLSAEDRNCTQPPVEQWLKGFYEAEFVITDSFHACIFSIIFGKPFIVYGNKERGMARFTSLLSLFNLEDRLILQTEDYSPSKINSDIIEAQRLLSKYREHGYHFLQNALQ